MRKRLFWIAAGLAGAASLNAAHGSAAQAPAPAEGEIRSLRAASNRAIAAHDMKAFLPLFAEDAGFVFSNATTASGRAGLEAVFARDFADPAFVTYIRSRRARRGAWGVDGDQAEPRRRDPLRRRLCGPLGQ
jgi:hypothetical protein